MAAVAVEPLAWCARCGSEDVDRVEDAAGVGVIVKCRPCGHVLSLIALRNVQASVAEDSPERVVDKLWVLSGQTRPRAKLSPIFQVVDALFGAYTLRSLALAAKDRPGDVLQGGGIR